MTPVLPSEFQSAVVLPEDDIGIAIVKAHVIFPLLLTAWYEHVFNPDGSFTDAFRQEICSINCTTLPST